MKKFLIGAAIGAAIVTLANFNQPHFVRSFELHTVKPGETLWSISCDIYDKGVHRDIREIIYDISTDNSIVNGEIHSGQVLKLYYWTKKE